MDRLRRRADFLRAQRGIRRTAPALTLEAIPTPEDFSKPGRLRVGFTATKKIGGAIARNRAKRRLRAAAVALLPLYGGEGNDYVLVARPATLTAPFAQLLDDLIVLLEGAHKRLARSERPS